MSSSEAIDDADAPDLAARQRVVGVAPHLRRQIEGHREPGLPLRRAGSGSAGSTRAAVPKPAYWRIVQSRPRYIVGCTPRVNGNSPGQPELARRSRTAASRRAAS